jgi:hypothetical protein
MTATTEVIARILIEAETAHERYVSVVAAEFDHAARDVDVARASLLRVYKAEALDAERAARHLWVARYVVARLAARADVSPMASVSPLVS